LRAAGRQIITTGAIEEDTRVELNRDLMPGDLLQKHEMANQHWLRLRRRAGVEGDAPVRCETSG
jgi:hypothetical protein